MKAINVSLPEHKDKPDWVVVDRNGRTYRLQVPGGWLYKSGTQFDSSAPMVFVPDPRGLNYN